MAGRRPKILWSKLKPATQKRKLNFYKKQGLSDSAIRAKYNTGTLGPQSAARGHGQTPERPTRAARNPIRYEKYIQRHQRLGGETGPVLTVWDRAYINMIQKLGDHIGFNPARSPQVVKNNIYGTPDGKIPRMSEADAEWTATADVEALRAKGRIQYPGNPWFYHP